MIPTISDEIYNIELMKKRSFVLLEVLLALSLVTICLLPLVKQPLKLYREEITELEKLELERMADWAFIEVKEMLLKNEILWEQIPQKGSHSEFFTLTPATLQLPGFPAKKIERKFYLSGRGEKTDKNGTIYRQLGIYISLGAYTYPFRLPVERLLVE